MTAPTGHSCRTPLDSLTETTCPECRHESHLEILRYREFLRAEVAREAAPELSSAGRELS